METSKIKKERYAIIKELNILLDLYDCFSNTCPRTYRKDAEQPLPGKARAIWEQKNMEKIFFEDIFGEEFAEFWLDSEGDQCGITTEEQKELFNKIISKTKQFEKLYVDFTEIYYTAFSETRNLACNIWHRPLRRLWLNFPYFIKLCFPEHTQN